MILKQHYFKQNVLSILALSVHSFGTVFLTVIYLQFQQLMISKEKKLEILQFWRIYIWTLMTRVGLRLHLVFQGLSYIA